MKNPTDSKNAITVNTAEYIDTLLSLLESGRTDLPLPIKGTSMVPFLHEGDTVYINRLSREPRRGDVLLFRRPDGTYVLHRAVRKAGDGLWLFLGDGQTQKEPVKRERICACATEAKRKGKLISKKSLAWRFYSTVWLSLVPLRPLIGKFHNAKNKKQP